MKKDLKKAKVLHVIVAKALLNLLNLFKIFNKYPPLLIQIINKSLLGRFKAVNKSLLDL